MCVLCLQRCAEMQHGEVRIVKGVDERLTGEAYVHISGSRAKLRLALAKDRTLMPVCCSSLTASPLSLYSTVMALKLLCSQHHSSVLILEGASRLCSCDELMHWTSCT